MGIQDVAIVGKGAVGLLYGSIAAAHLGAEHVQYVMDEERLARHAADALKINGKPCELESITPEGMPSMAQDRLTRRPTEVEEFAGTICRLGHAAGIQVPQNEWLYEQIRSIEAGW